MNNKTKFMLYLLLMGMILSLLIPTYIVLQRQGAEFTPRSFMSQVDLLIEQVGRLVLNNMPRVLAVAFVIIFSQFLIWLFSIFIRQYMDDSGHPEDAPVITSLVRYTVWTLCVLVSLTILVRGFGSLLTSLGLIGFGLTFALQKPILNFVGWINVITHGYYRIGDRIQVNGVGGDVENIEMMNTTLHELVPNTYRRSGKMVTFPNEWVLMHALVNFTRGSPLIIDEAIFPITFESNWKKAGHLMQQAAREATGNAVSATIKTQAQPRTQMFSPVHLFRKLGMGFAGGLNESSSPPPDQTRLPGIDPSLIDQPQIRMDMDVYSIHMRVRYLVNAKDASPMRTEVTKRILELFEKEPDVILAYPHTQVVTDRRKETASAASSESAAGATPPPPSL